MKYLEILDHVSSRSVYEENEFNEESTPKGRLNSFSSFNSYTEIENTVRTDRPIRDEVAAWLLELTDAERRQWWRAVVRRFNQCDDWAQAEDEATTGLRWPPLLTERR